MQGQAHLPKNHNQRGLLNRSPFLLGKNMDEKTINAIHEALDNGLRVEILKDKDGNVIVQTIQRKRIKIK